MKQNLNFLRSFFHPSHTEVDYDYLLISYAVELSFETDFQVGYISSEGRFIIREYSGKTFDYEFYSSSDFKNIRLQVFLTNPALLEDQHIKLIIKSRNVIVGEKLFTISSEYRWAGWFELNASLD